MVAALETTPGKSPAGRAAAKRRVLIIASHPGARMSMRACFEASSHPLELVEARTGLAARDVLGQGGANLILVDLGDAAGAEKRGTELAEIVFSGAGVRGRGVPVILCGDAGSEKALEKSTAAFTRVGATRQKRMTRPLDNAQVEAALAELLGLERPARAETRSADPKAPADPKGANPFAGIVEAIRRGEVPLPAAPQVVTQIRKLVNNGKLDPAGLSDVVGLDPSVSASVLRLAGSVAYGSVRKPRNLREAVTRIGALQVARVAETVAARDCYGAKHPSLAPLMERAWRHVLARSLIVRHAARFEGADVQERQYLQSLLCDLGEGFLARMAAERAGSGFQISDSFRAMIEAHHAAVGAILLSSWNAPAECVDTARDHHSTAQRSPVALRIFFAGSAAAQMGYEPAFSTAAPMPMEELSRVLGLRDDKEREKLKSEIDEQLTPLG